MLELNDGPAPAEDLIKDSSEATFMQDVIETSQTVPVIVDFWAPWCGPCKTMGPALEAAVKAAGGKVKMVKVDIDQNQTLAGQMRVQSIPMVFAFSGGQPVDGFQGAQPPSEIKAFVEKIAAMSGAEGDGLADAVATGQEMLEQGAAVDAAQTFAAILGEDASNAAAFAGLAKSHLAMGELEQAKALLNSASDEIAKDPAVLSVKAQIELTENAVDAGDITELRAKLKKSADDHQVRMDLAMALVGSGEAEAAIEELLELFRRDREWNDGGAKEQLLKIFDSLGPKDATASTGRRKLSSMIFV